MKFSRKFISALVVIALMLSMVAALAAEITVDGKVQFVGSAYGYEKAGKSKSKIIISKGSVSWVEDLNKKKDWVLVALTAGNWEEKKPLSLWFPAKYLKAVSEEIPSRLRYGAGGSGRSTVWVSEKTFAVLQGGKKIKATGKCNIRKSPSLAGKSLGIFKKGKKMTLTGKAGLDSRGVVWYQVKFSWKDGKADKKTAWVSEEYTDYRGKLVEDDFDIYLE